ncbi:Gamma carbonic anhydrase 2, mitochondrial [Galdieria sulphuraria]|nr:Gamma carbonic anhydrase 2, mitochondrial [Galdieria sulphuraria]
MSVWSQICQTTGNLLRKSGQALDKVGEQFQGVYAYKELLSRHHRMRAILDKKPLLSSQVFVAPNASVIGTVELGPNSSVWYGAIVRGDVASVSIGENTNVQDRACIHLSKGDSMFQGGLLNNCTETVIGSRVSIGHGAIIHGAHIQDECMHAIVGSGAVVPRKAIIPTGELWAGSPARFVRKLLTEEIDAILQSAEDYTNLAAAHAVECSKSLEEIESDKIARKLRSELTADHAPTATDEEIEAIVQEELSLFRKQVEKYKQLTA